MKLLLSIAASIMLFILQGCSNTGPNPFYMNEDGTYTPTTTSPATTNQSYMYRSPSPTAVNAIKAGGIGGGAAAGGGGGHGGR